MLLKQISNNSLLSHQASLRSRTSLYLLPAWSPVCLHARSVSSRSPLDTLEGTAKTQKRRESLACRYHHEPHCLGLVWDSVWYNFSIIKPPYKCGGELPRTFGTDRDDAESEDHTLQTRSTTRTIILKPITTISNLLVARPGYVLVISLIHVVTDAYTADCLHWAVGSLPHHHLLVILNFVAG